LERSSGWPSSRDETNRSIGFPLRGSRIVFVAVPRRRRPADPSGPFHPVSHQPFQGRFGMVARALPHVFRAVPHSSRSCRDEAAAHRRTAGSSAPAASAGGSMRSSKRSELAPQPRMGNRMERSGRAFGASPGEPSLGKDLGAAASPQGRSGTRPRATLSALHPAKRPTHRAAPPPAPPASTPPRTVDSPPPRGSFAPGRS